MSEFLAKLPLASLALLLGTTLTIVAVLSQVNTKWFSVTLSTAQRLMIGTIGIALAAVIFIPQGTKCDVASRCLPISQMPLVEKAPAVALQDTDGTLFVRAKEVHRFVDPSDNRRPYIELEFDAKDGLLSHKVDVFAGQVAEIHLAGDRNYSVWYERSGSLDKIRTDPNSQPFDVALISIERKR